jgi:DNA-binding transcriptional LysR family regulator
LSAASFDSLHAQLLNDEISFYVADQTLGVESERCDVQPLLDEEVAFVTKPDHVLANRTRVSPSDLVKYPFVGVADKIPAILRRWFLSGLTTDREQELLERNYPFVVCDHYEASRVLLLSTDYVTGGPIDLVQKDIDSGIVARLNLSKFDSVIATGLITRKDRTLSPASQALKRCFEDEYENR